MRRVFGFILLMLLGGSAFGSVGARQEPERVPVSDTSSKSAQDCEKPQEQFVTVNGKRVHYLESGAGPTVVLIHGNAGNVDDFTYRAIRVLCTDYKVVAVDRPGHGKSDRLREKPEQLESQAGLLHDTLASLNIKRPILVGHSWGASLALAYALHYQDDIGSMVLL